MRRRLICSVLGSVLLFARCDSSIDNEFQPKKDAVPICITINDSQIATRAPISALIADSLGIYAVQESSTTPGIFPWTASPYISNLRPTTITNGQISFSPKIYYPDAGKRLMFYGYYHRTTATSGANYIAAPGSGIAPVYNFTLTGQEDIIHAVSTPFGSNTPGIPSLSFNHKLTQIILNTSLLSGLTNIKLVGVMNKGALNLETGNVTYNTSSLINIPLTVQGGILAGQTIAVIVPANVDKYRVDVTLAILTTTYYIRSSTGTFLPGKIYTIAVP